MARYGAHSVLGGNIRFLNDKYFMDNNEIQKQWAVQCQVNDETIRIVEQVKELINSRDDYLCKGFLNREECEEIILYLWHTLILPCYTCILLLMLFFCLYIYCECAYL